jgi:hypothetical protein
VSLKSSSCDLCKIKIVLIKSPCSNRFHSIQFPSQSLLPHDCAPSQLLSPRSTATCIQARRSRALQVVISLAITRQSSQPSRNPLEGFILIQAKVTWDDACVLCEGFCLSLHLSRRERLIYHNLVGVLLYSPYFILECVE